MPTGEDLEWLQDASESWTYLAADDDEPGGTVFVDGVPTYVGFVSSLFVESSDWLATTAIHEGYHLAFGQDEPAGDWEKTCVHGSLD